MDLEKKADSNEEKIFGINNDIIRILISNLILQNNMSFDHHFSLVFEKDANELSFLNKKRKYKKIDLEENNQSFFKTEINQMNKKLEDLNKNAFPHPDELKMKMNQTRAKNDIKNKAFNYKRFPKLETNENYINNNLNENYSKFIPSLKHIENKRYENTSENIISNTNSGSTMTKNNKYFNNEIKVKKNNKVVYMNSYLVKYNTPQKVKKDGENKRSSQYRGVSRNGKQWQVLMMANRNKSYIGTFCSEELAARIYDIISIKNKGIKAKTNFEYNNRQIQNIIEKDIDIKNKDISKIVAQLIM